MREKQPGGLKRLIASIVASVCVMVLFVYAVLEWLSVEATGTWNGQQYHNTLPANEFWFLVGGCVIALLMVGLNLVIIRDHEIE